MPHFWTAALTRRDFQPPFIITGETNRERVQACLKAGADDFLAKPLQMEELLACVGATFQTAQISDPVDRLRQYILAIRDLRHRLSEGTKIRHQPSTEARVTIDSGALGRLSA
jgi:DNA-binding response OmpR family regulator